MKAKLAISALLALIVATTICSSVRADVLPTPQSLLLELRETVLEASDWVFKGYIVTNTRQQKNALARKIDATIRLYEITEHEEAADKLVDDIRPKLTNPWNDDGTPSKRARSWLELYPYDSEEWRVVSSFAAGCQGLIENILMWYAPSGRGIVVIEPNLMNWGVWFSKRLIFKSYVPYTVTVYSIYYELWRSGELLESGVYASSDIFYWETGTVPPFQEVEIWVQGGMYPGPESYGDYWLGVVFHTSVGDFPASGDWKVTIWA